MINQEPF